MSESVEQKGELLRSAFEYEGSEKQNLLRSTEHKGKLSWRMAILFIVGEVVGGGVVAMGDASANAGWWSLGIMLVSLGSNLYMSKILSEIITIVGEEDRHKARDPYTRAVQHSLGHIPKKISQAILYIFTICVTTIYLLISTELLISFFQEFVPDLLTHYKFRFWICIITAFLIPISWFGSPSDFWMVALFAVLTTTCAAILFTTNLFLHAPSDLSKVPVRKVTPVTFFFGFGTILFGFCGVPFFPNIQSDMKDGTKMFKSAFISYIIVAFIYIPVGLLGMILLGDKVKPNIINNALELSNVIDENMKVHLKRLGYASLILLAGHFICAYNLVFNNIAQDLEEKLKISRGFGWQRCTIRTILVLFTLLCAQCIPRFDIIVSLSGGLLISPLSFHIPSLMYWKLKVNATISQKVTLVVICVIGTIACFGSIYANVMSLFHFYNN